MSDGPNLRAFGPPDAAPVILCEEHWPAAPKWLGVIFGLWDADPEDFRRDVDPRPEFRACHECVAEVLL